jgi:hypothetical protein
MREHDAAIKGIWARASKTSHPRIDTRQLSSRCGFS